MVMARVYVVKSDWEELEVEAKKLGVRSSSLLSYVIEEHSMFVTPENAPLFVELNDIPRKLLTTATISPEAHRAVRDMAFSCRLRLHTVVTAILRDVLPSLRDFPELFPGLGVMQKMAYNNAIGRKSPPIGLNWEVYEGVVRRIRLNVAREEKKEGEETVQLYVSSVLDSLSTREFCEAVRQLHNAGNLDPMLFPGARKQRTIRVPLDTYALLSELGAEIGVSCSKLLSFIIKRELVNTEVTLTTWETYRLPEDIRRRWGNVLKDLAARKESSRD